VARRRVKYQDAPVWLVAFSDVMGYSIGDLAVININRLFIKIEMYVIQCMFWIQINMVPVNIVKQSWWWFSSLPASWLVQVRLKSVKTWHHGGHKIKMIIVDGRKKR
jgi:hypothetical protein